MGGLQAFVSFTCKSLTRSLQQISELKQNKTKQNKKPSGFRQGEGKINHFDMFQSIAFFLRRPALKRKYFIRSYPVGVLSEPNLLWEGKSPTPAPISHPVPLMWGKNLRCMGEDHSPGAQACQKTETNHRTIDLFPLSLTLPPHY